MKFFERLIGVPAKKRIDGPKKEELLSDLLKVGPDKPVGYLPLSTLESMEVDIDNLSNELRKKGLVVKRLSTQESRVASGALYVYDREALRQLLYESRYILAMHEWPLDPDEFVLHLKVLAPRGPLHDLISRAFGK